jgi:K+ transporter
LYVYISFILLNYFYNIVGQQRTTQQSFYTILENWESYKMLILNTLKGIIKSNTSVPHSIILSVAIGVGISVAAVLVLSKADGSLFGQNSDAVGTSRYINQRPAPNVRHT